MKRLAGILVIAFLVFATGCNSQSKEGLLKWNTNLEAAVKIAQKEHKPILVNFTGSDWCKWCKKLNAEVFTQDAFIDYAKKNLILVKIDFPRYKKLPASVEYYNRQLATKFGVQGFPTIALLNSSGQPVAMTGYRDGGAQAYVNHLKSLL